MKENTSMTDRPMLIVPPVQPDADVLGDGLKQKSIGTFVSQRKAHLVEEMHTYKVSNKAYDTLGMPGYKQFMENQHDSVSELEQMYKEFCEKAYMYLITHPSLQADTRPYKIIFPDFVYELYPNKFPVE
jgi:hypothetical protein